MKKDYQAIRDCINEQFVLNSPENCFVAEYLWTLPEKWIHGLAGFIREYKNERPNGWICCQLLHDIGGFVHKEIGFSPRCFRGGNVWDKKILTVS